jgi:hypothetical protein
MKKNVPKDLSTLPGDPVLSIGLLTSAGYLPRLLTSLRLLTSKEPGYLPGPPGYLPGDNRIKSAKKPLSEPHLEAKWSSTVRK